MTIAVGLMTGNAAILCADSQEVVSDYSKGTTQKIRVTTFFDKWRIGIAGSSDNSNYLDAFEDEMQRTVGKIPDFDYARIVNTIEVTLRGFHKTHIWPLPKDERPTMEMLLAIQGIKPHPSRALLFAHRTLLQPVRGYRGIGIGSYLSDYLAKGLDPYGTGKGIRGEVYNSSTEEMARFGVFLVDQVKRSINGCDGETVVAIFGGDGKLTWLPSFEVKDIEGWFESFRNDTRPLFRIVSNAELDDDVFKQRMSQFEVDMRLLRAKQAKDSETMRKRREDFFKAQTSLLKKQLKVKPSASGKSK